MTEPQQKPGRSKQDYGTPKSFLAAIGQRFGAIDFDLAATADNAVAERWYAPDVDSLRVDWKLPGVRVAFLNPPFANIRPWAAKCESVRDLARWTLLLVPASMGSHWWFDHVEDKCLAIGITRIQFVGTSDPYPKDLALLAYGFGVKGTASWAWGESVPAMVVKKKSGRAA